MTDEPYRWLEAVANRREYIRDQLKGGTPVFALSRPEGVLLLGVGTGKSKVFEIYDRQALAALGHPVDIERVRQTVIEAAHMEGFTRAAEDVTIRRLLSFSVGPLLKAAFEQIFAAPLLVECVLAELGGTAAEDVLARVHFDGTHSLQNGGLVVAHTDPANEAAAADWLKTALPEQASLRITVAHLLAVHQALLDGRPFVAPAVQEAGELRVEGKVIELGLLDRRLSGRVRYRALDLASLS